VTEERGRNVRNVKRFYFIVMFLALAVIIFLAWYIVTNVEAIKNNPFIYGAKVMGNVECTCYKISTDKSQTFLPFFFNASDFWFPDFKPDKNVPFNASYVVSIMDNAT